MKDCKNLLILRPDNLGDMVLFSGAFKHIRNYFQNATISLCAKKYVEKYVEYSPYIDHIYSWEKYAIPSSRIVSNIRGRQYILGWFDQLYRKQLIPDLKTEVLLVPLRSPSKGIYGTHAIVSEISAKNKVGIAGDLTNQNPQTDAKSNSLYTQSLELGADSTDLHELNVTAKFLQSLGINIDVRDLWPEVWTTQDDKTWAEQNIPKSSTSIVLALCPGATEQRKLYPIEQYRAIFGSFDQPLTIVLFGTKSERNLCEQIHQQIKDCTNIVEVLNLAGDTTIRQLIEGMRNCDIVLSTDSASLHLSVAIKKPVVGMMGGWQYGRFYPWGDPNLHKVVNKPMDCYGCNSRCLFPSIKCIEEIDPMKIALELKGLIENIYREKRI